MMLEARDLSWSAGPRRIVDQVHLGLQDGECLGLIGPNGSGKSTLLRMLYRVLRPDIGCVLLEGRDIQDMTARQFAAQASVLAQESPHGFDFTVREAVLMGRIPHQSPGPETACRTWPACARHWPRWAHRPSRSAVSPASPVARSSACSWPGIGPAATAAAAGRAHQSPGHTPPAGADGPGAQAKGQQHRCPARSQHRSPLLRPPPSHGAWPHRRPGHTSPGVDAGHHSPGLRRGGRGGHPRGHGPPAHQLHSR